MYSYRSKRQKKLVDDLFSEIKDKCYVFDRSKSADEDTHYYMIRGGCSVTIRARTRSVLANPHARLRIVPYEFCVNPVFLRGTMYKEHGTRGEGVHILPHLLYEEWDEDTQSDENDEMFVDMELKGGTIIPPSFIHDALAQEDSNCR
jgi:hypothetical protein